MRRQPPSNLPKSPLRNLGGGPVAAYLDGFGCYATIFDVIWQVPSKGPMRLLLIAALPAFLCAQEHGIISANPYSTTQDSETGGAAFRARCAGCHGLDASGGAQAPSLVS